MKIKGGWPQHFSTTHDGPVPFSGRVRNSGSRIFQLFVLTLLYFLSTPARSAETPVLVAKWPDYGAGGFKAVAARDQLVYGLDVKGGLHIVNVTNPAAPVLLGSYSESRATNDVVLHGNLAFLVGWSNGLEIVDISDPSRPSRKGYVDTPGLAAAVRVKGDYAYVADFYHGVQVINIQDPEQPVIVGNYPTTRAAYDLAVFQDYLYVLVTYVNRTNVGSLPGMDILSITNPVQPVYLNHYGPASAYKFQIIDSLGYLATYHDLQILDLSDPVSPVLLSKFEGIGYDVFVELPIAYFQSGNRVKLVDVSNPLAPRLRSEVPGRSLGGLCVLDEHLYLAEASHGLKIINVADPDRHFEVMAFRPSLPAYDVVVDAGRAYLLSSSRVSGRGEGPFQIIHLLNPERPALLGRFDLERRSVDVELRGKLGYLIGGNGLQVLDLSSPAQPRILGSNSEAGSAGRITVSGTRAYLTGLNGKFSIFDLSNPEAPQKIGELLSSPFMHAAVSGDLAYAVGDKTFRVLSVANSTNIFSVGFLSVTGFVWEVKLAGSIAYLAAGSGGLHLVDISLPSQPRLLSSWGGGGGDVHRVTLSGSRAFVSDRRRGLVVLDISNPLQVVEVGVNPNYLSGGGIAVYGNYILVADSQEGLAILRLGESQPAFQTLPPVGGWQQSGLPISISSEAGKTNTLQRSVDLLTWTDVTNFVSTGATQSFVDTQAVTNAKGYYRLARP